MTEKSNIDNNFRLEIFRKLINLYSLIIPATYLFITKTLTLQILTPITIVSLIIDVARQHHQPTHRIFDKMFGFLLRKHERDIRAKNLGAHTWFLIAATVCIAIFPKYITVISLAMFQFADTASALIGRRFGRKRFGNRSIEGSIAFVVAAIIVVVLTPKIEYRVGEYFISSLTGLIGAAVEILSYNIIDDNFSVPVSIGITMWLLYTLCYPEMNIYQLNFF